MLADRRAADQERQFLRFVQRMMVVFEDYVATPESRDFGRPVLEYIGNHRAPRFTQARGLRDFGGNRLDINPEPSALDLAVRPEFRQLRLHQVDRDGGVAGTQDARQDRARMARGLY